MCNWKVSVGMPLHAAKSFEIRYLEVNSDSLNYQMEIDQLIADSTYKICCMNVSQLDQKVLASNTSHFGFVTVTKWLLCESKWL